MKIKVLFFLASIILFQQSGILPSKGELFKFPKEWKFMPGDNTDYAKVEFNDSNWKDISIAQTWEAQGYPGLDGYAWYRTRIIIPSSIKNNLALKDSIEFYFGKIDDYDQVFINGKLIGVNCKPAGLTGSAEKNFNDEHPVPWNKERFYRLALSDSAIKWDKENIIAVRVYDHGGDGGMFYGIPEIRGMEIKDYFQLDCFSNQFKTKGNKSSKTVILKNISNKYFIEGKLTISVKEKNETKLCFLKNYNLKLSAGESKELQYQFPFKNQLCHVDYKIEFSNNQGGVSHTEIVPYILTPLPNNKPKINGAAVYGQRPGRPFLYSVAATGARPMVFDAVGLPKGLTIDKETGIITGRADEKGEYNVTLSAKNKFGSAKSQLKISIGDKIALTPPMGWNSWNVWGLAIDQQKVMASAKVFKEKGLMNHGWGYINIDDGWEIEGLQPAPKRDSKGKILCNSNFPDMKALGDSIHAMGLKFGIYSAPGTLTCGGYTASYLHEAEDAESYASWGVDYLKYDWCSYEKIAKDHSPAELKKPYLVMNEALKNINRDIIYSLCQYGMGEVWKWGDSVGGNLWRTTGDITDTWESMSSIGFSQVKNAVFAKPGNWNDPDMLVVGSVGWGSSLHQTALTPDEQYTHISLWCLLSAPLLIGCDLTRLDDFTLNLLTNDEVLALDQDPLGKQAVPLITDGNIQVWVKELVDGSRGIGIFNLGEKCEEYTLDFSKIGAPTGTKVRDLWRQKNLNISKNKLHVSVEGHGVVLIKATR